jgi:hypothetical protein
MWLNRAKLPLIFFLNALLTSSPETLVTMNVGLFRSFRLDTLSSLLLVEGRLFNSLHVLMYELPSLTLRALLSFL